MLRDGGEMGGACSRRGEDAKDLTLTCRRPVSVQKPRGPPRRLCGFLMYRHHSGFVTNNNPLELGKYVAERIRGGSSLWLCRPLSHSTGIARPSRVKRKFLAISTGSHNLKPDAEWVWRAPRKYRQSQCWGLRGHFPDLLSGVL